MEFKECRISRFYGFEPEVIAEMGIDQFSQYYIGMEQIECQEALLGIQIFSYPKMKKQDQSRLFRKLHSRAFPVVDKGPMSMEQLKEYLSGR